MPYFNGVIGCYLEFGCESKLIMNLMFLVVKWRKCALIRWINLNNLIAQRELGVTWDVDLYGELLKIGGGKER